MEVTLVQNDIVSALEKASRISIKHVTLPVLQCVKLVATNESLTISATNLEVSFEIVLEGTVSEPGEIAVPTQTFLQSLQHLSEQKVTLRTEDQVLQIETKNSSTSIKVFASDEFPSINKITGTKTRIDRKMFALGVKNTAFAASQTSIKPELGSVFLQQKKEHSLTCVATDSFRLMEKTIPQKGLVLEQTMMIPQKNALELAKICEATDEDPEFVTDENQCALFFGESLYISSRLVNGSFPDYVQIIPKEFVTHATVLKEDLLKSFKKTNIFLNKFRQVSLVITKDGLTISSQNSDVGHTTNTVAAEVEGEELTLSFNQQYIVEPLQYIHDDTIKLSFAGLGRAMIMQGLSDKSSRYLVMPMNK